MRATSPPERARQRNVPPASTVTISGHRTRYAAAADVVRDPLATDVSTSRRAGRARRRDAAAVVALGDDRVAEGAVGPRDAAAERLALLGDQPLWALDGLDLGPHLLANRGEDHPLALGDVDPGLPAAAQRDGPEGHDAMTVRRTGGGAHGGLGQCRSSTESSSAARTTAACASATPSIMGHLRQRLGVALAQRRPSERDSANSSSAARRRPTPATASVRPGDAVGPAPGRRARRRGSSARAWPARRRRDSIVATR